MSKTRRLQQIRSDMFEVITELHNNITYKRQDMYKLCLVAMDDLNEEYKSLTGNYYLNELECLNYYEKLWSVFNA